MVKESRYVVIDNAPHGCLWTHADEVNRALLEFIRAPARPAPDDAVPRTLDV
jgi:pimeloyl-ACP methyl ester carboxylesterase